MFRATDPNPQVCGRETAVLDTSITFDIQYFRASDRCPTQRAFARWESEQAQTNAFRGRKPFAFAASHTVGCNISNVVRHQGGEYFSVLTADSMSRRLGLGRAGSGLWVYMQSRHTCE
jgi:hypothetical protein